jgi:hypothetical protein
VRVPRATGGPSPVSLQMPVIAMFYPDSRPCCAVGEFHTAGERHSMGVPVCGALAIHTTLSDTPADGKAELRKDSTTTLYSS